MAAWRSSATSFSSSSFFISVSSSSAPPSSRSCRQLPLRLDQLVDLLLDRAAAHELVHEHVLGLADAERAIGGLILHRRVPPAVEVDDVRRGGQIEAGAARLEREHEERHRLVLLELPHQRLALLDGGLAVQHQPGPAEHRPRKAASGAVTSRNCVKTSTFSCFAAMTSAISRRRANLPLSASRHAPSPSHCDG